LPFKLPMIPPLSDSADLEQAIPTPVGLYNEI